MRCIEFLCYFVFRIPNFGIGIPICQFFNSRIQKKLPTGISGIKNRIGIPLPMGVPEIGTENRNSQPRLWPKARPKAIWLRLVLDNGATTVLYLPFSLMKYSAIFTEVIGYFGITAPNTQQSAWMKEFVHPQKSFLPQKS
jgi:hypothetical protein